MVDQRRARVVSVLFSLLWIFSSMAMAVSSNQINQIRLTHEEGYTVIEIAGERSPNFTTFKQDVPRRVIVDVAECHLNAIPTQISGDDELVGGITTAQYGKTPHSISRVIIQLRREAEYRVTIRGGSLFVHLAPGEGGMLVSAGIPIGPEQGESSKPSKKKTNPSESEKTPKSQEADQPIADARDLALSDELFDPNASKQTTVAHSTELKAEAMMTSVVKYETLPQPPDKNTKKEAKQEAKQEVKQVATQEVKQAAKQEVKQVAKQEVKQPSQQKAITSVTKKPLVVKSSQKPTMVAMAVVPKENPRNQNSSKDVQGFALSTSREKELIDDNSVKESERIAMAVPPEQPLETISQQPDKQSPPPKPRALAQSEPPPEEPPVEVKDETPIQPPAEDTPPTPPEETTSTQAPEETSPTEKTEPPPPPPEEVTPPPVEKPEAEERVEISGALKHMTWVGFQQTQDASRVFVKTSEPVTYRVVEEGDKLIVLELDNTSIPLKNNRRFLDTHFFDSAVTLIVPKEIEGVSRSVRIEIQLKNRVPYRSGQEENIVYVSFERSR